MKKILTKSLLKIIGIVIGGIGGYTYYHFVGCASGTCPITSNPYITIAYGALLGYLFSDIFKKKKNETT